MSTAFDLIGDIHGRIEVLEALLDKLGYRQVDGVYEHPQRRVVFLGDFIDRGPGQRQVVNLARNMVRAGTALAVMGNHEFNALAFHTQDPDKPGTWLRKRTDRNIRQHLAFLNAYLGDPAGLRELEGVLDWFRSLPVYLDLGDLRVVHACWDPESIDVLAPRLGPGNTLTDDLLVDCCHKGRDEFDAIETLLKGREIRLPEGASFRDKDGTLRHRIRIRWWEQGEQTYRSIFMGPESAETHIPDDPVPGDHLLEYNHGEPPVFLGHYWLEGEPEPLADNVCCLDYSAAKPGGKLAAYRWDGEARLNGRKFVWVPS